MKKIYTLFLITSFTLSLFGQLSEGGVPYSKQIPTLKSTEISPSINLKKINFDKLLSEDKKNTSLPLRYAVVKEVSIDIRSTGLMQETDEGRVWTFKVTSPNAISLSLVFSEYKLPQGAKLFIYNDDYSSVFGAFTSKNNKSHGLFPIADFVGSNLTIEYFEPKNAEFEGKLILGSIGQAYRDIYNSGVGFKATEATEYVEINCPEGDKLQLEKHAVAKMTFNGYLCSGALINNARNDGTPYFLTANHCINDVDNATGLVTYFNFEFEDCNSTTRIDNRSISGSSYLAGFEDTDFTLLLLDEVPTEIYQPYYAGWNAESDDEIEYGSGIHHPSGTEKKVSLTFNEIISYPYETNWDGGLVTSPNSHWLVFYDKGITSGGSSGSPLFDDNERIIGQLHGGDEDNVYDFYGKLSQSWNATPDHGNKLSSYLDPDNTGILQIDGYTPTGNYIDAFPYTDYNNVCSGQTIVLKDGSLFGAESWTWTITPTSFDFVNGTDANSQNPEVVFNAEEAYSVSLQVTGGGRNNTHSRENYISTTGLDMYFTTLSATNTCQDNYQDVKVNLVGADSFNYKIINGEEYLKIDSSLSDKNTFVVTTNGILDLDSSLVGKVAIEGIYGECYSYDTILINIFTEPSNDSIKNAIALQSGDNGTFSNHCATASENEPYPTIGGCDVPGEWCDCEDGENRYIENSVWFTFIGPSTGAVGIDCPGFDNQIAVYEADTYDDIMSGDNTRYDIIAASDDWYGEIDNYAAKIEQVNVTAGQKYWLQVDGSACGTSGNFKVIITEEEEVNSNYIVRENNYKLKLYPNPVINEFFLEGICDTDLEVALFTLDGKLIQTYTIYKNSAETKHKFTIPAETYNGLYFMRISDGKESNTLKLSIQK